MAHALPLLPYPDNALEPYLDAQTMRLHHSKHHQAYVDGLNKAEANLVKARESGDYSLIQHWERQAAFHGSGHLLHSLFWPNMAPPDKGGGGRPTGELLARLTENFGSWDNFRAQFGAASAAIEGSGWGILAFRPGDDKLVILTAENHQKLTQWGVGPLLVLDVWEHAYYLKYQNRRSEYIEAWWQVVNWQNVAENLSRLTQTLAK